MLRFRSADDIATLKGRRSHHPCAFTSPADVPGCRLAFLRAHLVRLCRLGTFALIALTLLGVLSPAQAQRGQRRAQGDARAAGLPAQLAGIGLRSIGPAVTSGRVIAFAVDPTDSTHYFVAAASGGVWKTVNNGTTWTPVFDSQGSYSIGSIAIDPKSPNVVWVGTGELNAQRSVGYGDGVYRTEDGGKNWKNVGLKGSEHIGRIVIDPRDSNTVYVAAQGPLWNPGGERGLYKTTDAGASWKRILKVSDDTGITDVVVDPGNPSLLYAAAWQRRRHVFTYIGGGPESGIYRSSDAGATWTKAQSGLPSGDLGRIGLALSAAEPHYLYATVEATEGSGGIYRSSDFAASWEKRGPFVAQGMYYGQIIVDPKDPDRVYIPNVILMVSDDGGKTTRPLGERNKHVDNHTIWIDPVNTRHCLVGCDGGVYETFDHGESWLFKSNLPIAQFYRVATDNALPYYNVYGGTQDNNSLGGPSRTRSTSGIANDDWFVTLGGDGFHQQVDPTDPNIVYSVLQNGEASRLDRRTGETVGITPMERRGEPALRWNWDTPLLISPHSHTRLYIAANRLYRSDDRGNSWAPISPDLTRQIDRNALSIMGRVWRVDAIAKGQSTSFYGNIVALDESPRHEGTLWVGTDDGLIQMTEDGGKTWRKIETVPGVPDGTYVSCLTASEQAPDTVFAAFDRHKFGDFVPYLVKSVDAGKTWTSIVGDLPKNGPIHVIKQDSAAPNLLFVGTEFGAYFTLDGGATWKKLGGLPTIPVFDIAIQKRETDLVLATFGRGFYVLDDYSPLRTAAASPDQAARDALLFPVRDGLATIPYSRLGGGKGAQGDTYFTAPNPPTGVEITYYVKEAPKTRKQIRLESDTEAEKRKEAPAYPTAEQLRQEALEEPPALLLTVSDATGQVVRRLSEPAVSGVHRASWDLRGAGLFPTPPPSEEDRPRRGRNGGFSVVPGEYRVSLAKRVNGLVTELAGPVSFTVRAEGDAQRTPTERRSLEAMRHKVARLQTAVQGASEILDSLLARSVLIKRAVDEAPRATTKLRARTTGLEERLREVELELRGNPQAGERTLPEPPSVVERVQRVTSSMLGSSSMPTKTMQDAYADAAAEFTTALARLRTIAKEEMPSLERALDAAGVAYTPGRFPEWRDE
jgi:photosystem II stability/assembly factor-like uncharacterized protein